MSKRSRDYDNKNFDFRNVVYNEKNAVRIDELYFDDKLSNEEEIMNYLYEMMLNKGSINFVSAPTNAGKTYAINELFKKLNKVEKRISKDEILEMFKYQEDPEKCYRTFKQTIPTYMNVIAMPSNPQTIQVSRKYGLECLVGGDDYKELDMTKDAINVAMVYDMSKVLINMLEKDKYLKINLVIDEAHDLTSAQFRIKAIDDLERLKELVLENGGTITYLTATYTELAYLTDLNHILFCNKRVQEVDFDNLTLIVVNGEKSIEDIALNVLSNKKALVRFNRKEGQKDIQKELSLQGKKVYYVNADEKASFIDKKTNEKVYKNKMMNDIVNNEILPEDTDIAICTQLLDSGSNIAGIGNENNKPYNFDTIHFIRDSKDLNLSQIEQFVNRIRFKHNNHYIVIKKQVLEENEKVYNFNLRQILKFCFDKLQKQVEYLEAEIDILRRIKYKGEENIDELIEKAINDILEEENNYDGLKNSMGGCIRYKNGDIYIDYKFFLNYCLNKYNQSLYYNQDKFVKELEKIFNKKVKIVEMEDKDINLEVDKTTLEEYKKELLEQLKNGGCLFPYIYKTQFYKEAQKVYEFTHYEIMKCLEIVLSMNDKELQELYNKYSKKALQKLNKSEIQELNTILSNEKQLKDVKDNNLREEFAKIITNQSFREKLNNSNKKGINIDDFITHYCKTDDEKEFNRFVNEKRIIKNNINYKDGYKELLRDHANYDQLIVLEYIKNVKNYKIYKKNPTENIDKIDELIKELNDRTGHKYTRTKLINFIKQIYTYREVDEKIKGKNTKCIYLNSLKTKIK